MYKGHIISENNIVIFMTNGGMKTVSKTHKSFKKISAHLKNQEFQDAFDLIEKISHVKIKTKPIFTVKNDVGYYKNEKLPKSITKILQRFLDNNISPTAVINFWNRLKKNPREFARNELMLFLEHTGIPLCEDGTFITYKVIRDNYMDCHTESINNKPGAKIPRMDVAAVEHNRELCNAKGYHVAAWSYLSTMGYYPESGHRRLVECKVDPKDVVSIPNDYSNAKMRVTYYEIIREITGQKEENKEVLYDKTSLKKMSKMRLIIPASFLQKIRCKEGSTTSVIVGHGKLKIIKGKLGEYQYHVDTSSNIRISKSILTEADMLKSKLYTMYHDKDNNCLVIEPKEK